LFLPGVIPERALITADTSVLGVPGGSEEDISDSIRYQGISWKKGTGEVVERIKVDPNI
jgi:hypothetical protein